MTGIDDVLTLEREGWKALATSKAAAKEFYGEVLTEDARMLFPGGLRLVGKQAILEALAAQPWTSFELHDEDQFTLTNNVCGISYHVIAQREGQEEYEALISSTYIQTGGGWRLALHQQTPVHRVT